jgi:hypothetical protein
MWKHIIYDASFLVVTGAYKDPFNFLLNFLLSVLHSVFLPFFALVLSVNMSSIVLQWPLNNRPEAVPEQGHVTGYEKHLEYFEMGHQVQPAEFSEHK